MSPLNDLRQVAEGFGRAAIGPISGVLRVPHQTSAVTVARRRVRAELAAAGVPPAMVDDVELVICELLANAVRHARGIAGGALVVGWRVTVEQVRVRVTDGGSPSSVAPSPSRPLADSGRGLHIVERLADSWGVLDHPDGLRSVWASFRMQPDPELGRLHIVR